MKKLNYKNVLNHKSLTENKGITLIALIVTIIILLILSSITITILTNSNLISKAKVASENYKNKSNEEQKTLLNYTNIIDGYDISNSERENTSSTYHCSQLWKFDSSKSDVNNGLQTGTITLNDSVDNFDEIEVTGQAYGGSWFNQSVNLRIRKDLYYDNNLASSDNSNTSYLLNATVDSNTRRIVFAIKDNKHIIIDTIQTMRLLYIYGIKY